jgi:hypothetical protein
MDPSPYDDEDDIIADEAGFFDEDDGGPAQGYDEEMPPVDEEVDVPSADLDTLDQVDQEEIQDDGSVPGPTVPAYHSDEDDPSSVRDAYNSRKRPAPQVLFKFERCV